MATVRNLGAFRDVFQEVFAYEGVLDVASLVDAAGSTSTIAAPGVRLGDFVLAVSMGVDLVGVTVTAYVSASDVVSVRFQNESGATVDLASTLIRFVVAAKQKGVFS